MSTMFDLVASWRSLVAVLLVFGFAPGAMLRVIVLAFHRDDPRRDELVAELYAVPRLERPVWVFEQLEVALFEGLLERLRWAATGRIIHRWHLSSGVERNRQYPESFPIPSEVEKRDIQPGDFVKVMFEMCDGWGERMWVKVTDVKKKRLVGELSNQPIGIPRLDAGRQMKFERDAIIDIDPQNRPPILELGPAA